MLSPDLLGRLVGAGTVVSGRLHILSLDKLERHFGERWPKVRERALVVAEQTLMAGLGPNDLHHKAGETSWLLFFPSLDKATAQARCAMLAEKVYRRLIGDDTRFDDVRIDTLVIEADGRVLTEAADPLAALQAAFDAAAAENADTGEPEKKPPLGWKQEEPETFPTDIGFRFVPMLDVTRGVINTYHCEPWREAAGGVTLTGHGVLQTGERSRLVGTLDCLRLEAGLSAVRALRARGEFAVIAFPVHCRTIEATDSRRALLALLETITADERRLLAIGVNGLPEGAPAGRIGYIARFLQRFCRAVTVMRPLKQSRPERLEGTGAFGISLTLDNALHGEQSAGASLDEFVKGANRHHLGALAFGLATPMLVAHAMLSGFNYVSGNGLLPPQAAPEGLRPFPCDHFIRRLGAQRVPQMAAGSSTAGG